MARQIKKELLKTPRGTRDLMDEELFAIDSVIKKAEELSRFYGFNKIQTPHFEHGELFGASLGETTDVVEKQMYNFRTRGGDRLVLRPEGTAPIMRAYVEHGLQTRPQPVMFYYHGSFFRHESPQKYRFREFTQFGLEVLGEDFAVAEATIIRVFDLIFKELKLEVALELNTIGDKECRPAYRKELVSYYKKHVNRICKDCKRRLKENPLRLLDCKEETCLEIKKQAPQMIEYVCQECKTHFKDVLEFMDALEIPYHLNPFLVRGLDYYTRTVFEFTLADPENPEKKIEIGGGGRYDYLSQVIANKNIPAAGGALGLDRLTVILKEKGIELQKENPPKVFLIQIGDHAKRKSLYLLEEFRKSKVPLAQSLSKDSLRGQLKIADKLGVQFSLIIGQKEAMDGTIIIRDMESGVQETMPFEKALERIKIKIKR